MSAGLTESRSICTLQVRQQQHPDRDRIIHLLSSFLKHHHCTASSRAQATRAAGDRKSPTERAFRAQATRGGNDGRWVPVFRESLAFRARRLLLSALLQYSAGALPGNANWQRPPVLSLVRGWDASTTSHDHPMCRVWSTSAATAPGYREERIQGHSSGPRPTSPQGLKRKRPFCGVGVHEALCKAPSAWALVDVAY